MTGLDDIAGGVGFGDLMPTHSSGNSRLLALLAAEDIVPGAPASYQTTKEIYLYHPLGQKLALTPIQMAQSQAREITVPGGPESRLVGEFQREWKALGADQIIQNVMVQSRIYGIASVVVGDRKNLDASAEPLQLDRLHEMDLFFNVLDPLNTAGSLVLDQDPNSPDFQKATQIQVGSRTYHPSRSVIMMNEQPIYIEYTSSAFGYVGRSVYQRCLYALKTFLQSMITDFLVAQKAGLLIHKAKAPGSVVNNRMLGFFARKRQQLKGGTTGNVLTIDLDESIESLNFQNLEGAAKLSRENALKDIAMAAGMPAKLLESEALIEGFGEGTEDAKQIARYVDRVRMEMAPLYDFFDRITQRRAWSPEFYEAIQRDFPEYRDVPYETAFYRWSNSFSAIWPNLLAESDSEKSKLEDVRMKSVLATAQILLPEVDPANKAALIDWITANINGNRLLFSDTLNLDIDVLRTYVPPQPVQEPVEPRPFSSEA